MKKLITTAIILFLLTTTTACNYNQPADEVFGRDEVYEDVDAIKRAQNGEEPEVKGENNLEQSAVTETATEDSSDADITYKEGRESVGENPVPPIIDPAKGTSGSGGPSGKNSSAGSSATNKSSSSSSSSFKDTNPVPPISETMKKNPPGGSSGSGNAPKNSTGRTDNSGLVQQGDHSSVDGKTPERGDRKEVDGVTHMYDPLMGWMPLGDVEIIGEIY